MRNIDIATEVFIFQWGCFGASLEVIRDKAIALGIAEKQVVFKKNQEEMQNLFHQLAGFCDLHRFGKRQGTEDSQVASTEVPECLKKKDVMDKSIATEAKIFVLNNVHPSLEELRNKIISLNIAKERVVIKKGREKMENLLYQLSLFSENTPIIGGNVSTEEKKEIQKLMDRVKRKGPLKEVKRASVY